MKILVQTKSKCGECVMRDLRCLEDVDCGEADFVEFDELAAAESYVREYKSAHPDGDAVLVLL